MFDCRISLIPMPTAPTLGHIRPGPIITRPRGDFETASAFITRSPLFTDHRERRPDERMGDFRRQSLAGIRQHGELCVAQ